MPSATTSIQKFGSFVDDSVDSSLNGVEMASLQESVRSLVPSSVDQSNAATPIRTNVIEETDEEHFRRTITQSSEIKRGVHCASEKSIATIQVDA